MSKQINEQKLREFLVTFLGGYDWSVEFSDSENKVSTFHKKLNTGHSYESLESFYTIMLALLECAFNNQYTNEISEIKAYLNSINK